MLFAEQLLLQKCVGDRLHKSGLTIICSPAVATFDVFVVQYRVALLLHLGHHLARVARVNTVIASRCRKENIGVLHSRLDIVKRT